MTAQTSEQKNGHDPRIGELPKIWGSSLIFLEWLKLATSKLAFDKIHHKITAIRASARGLRLRELPEIWGPLLIFMQWLKLDT